MELLIIFLSLLSVTLVFSVINLYRKVTFYEDMLVDIEQQITQSVDRMRQIDLNGAFEADDEVGVVFNQMKDIVDNLGEYIYEQTQEEG
jgi:hypothetical protein